MLKAMFIKDGRTIDFSKMDPKKAVEEIVTGDDITLYLEDIVVSVYKETGTIAALDCGGTTTSPSVAVKHGITEGMMKSLLTLAIDDSSSYDGVEDFFDDFPVRFVP